MEMIFFFWPLVSLLIAGFLFLWPFLIWSHLREQTRLLLRIVEMMELDRSKKNLADTF